jgi:hypothetical protein
MVKAEYLCIFYRIYIAMVEIIELKIAKMRIAVMKDRFRPRMCKNAWPNPSDLESAPLSSQK